MKGSMIREMAREGVHEFDREKPKQKLLKPLTVLIRLYTRLWSRKSRERYLIDETASGVMLEGGNTLIIPARKVA